MGDTTQLLAALRDVQEPLAPEGTSMTLVAANILVAVLVVGLLAYRHYQKKHAWRKQLFRDLNRSKSLSPDDAITHIATTLRQLMISSGYEVESISGDEWLKTLNEHFNTCWFTQGDGQIFGNALYKPNIYTTRQIDTLRIALQSLLKRSKSNTSTLQEGLHNS